MTSKDRIRSAIEFKPSDRLGLWDIFVPDIKWQSRFDFDIALIFYERLNDYQRAKASGKFTAFSVNGPFEYATEQLGLQKLLEGSSTNKRKLFKLFEESLEDSIRRFERLKAKGYEFDAVWIWEDIAYDRGLFFSTKFYENNLFGLHRELFSYFKGEDVKLIYHSDGDLSSILPSLIDTGVDCLHPVESRLYDTRELRKKYKGYLALFGNVDIDLIKGGAADIEKLIKKIAGFYRDGGYIYSADRPIDTSIPLRNYDYFIKRLKTIKGDPSGVYQSIDR